MIKAKSHVRNAKARMLNSKSPSLRPRPAGKVDSYINFLTEHGGNLYAETKFARMVDNMEERFLITKYWDKVRTKIKRNFLTIPFL
jgi:hypothetical protein